MLSDFISFLYTLIPDSISQGASVADTLSNGSHLFEAMQNLLNQMNQIYSEYSFIISCIAFVICLTGCFFGYKLSGIFMTIISFIAGAVIGGSIGYCLTDSGSIMIIAAAIIGGIILMAASRGIYKVGIFLLSFALAFFAATSTLNTSMELEFFICTLIGLVAGVLAVRCIRPVIILVTAIFFGAHLPAFTIPVLEHMNADSALAFFNQSYAPLIFMILGIFVQFLTTEDPVKAKEKKEQEKRESGTPVFGHADIHSEETEQNDRNAEQDSESEPKPDDMPYDPNNSYGSGRHTKSSQNKGHTSNSSKKRNKKSLFASFMDAVDKGDSDADYPGEEHYPEEEQNPDNNNSNNIDYGNAAIDNSERPIENAEYRQIK